ncbi:hypothetical protein OTU49_008804 [Cherax quadricarinatus]|uniref:Uncharacterized protein n=1 Tax=Cherax quadricarinatus TaxID=27406 RepID=A0AAW0WQ75_CHEQU
MLLTVLSASDWMQADVSRHSRLLPLHVFLCMSALHMPPTIPEENFLMLHAVILLDNIVFMLIHVLTRKHRNSNLSSEALFLIKIFTHFFILPSSIAFSYSLGILFLKYAVSMIHSVVAVPFIKIHDTVLQFNPNN